MKVNYDCMKVMMENIRYPSPRFICNDKKLLDYDRTNDERISLMCQISKMKLVYDNQTADDGEITSLRDR